MADYFRFGIGAEEMASRSAEFDRWSSKRGSRGSHQSTSSDRNDVINCALVFSEPD